MIEFLEDPLGAPTAFGMIYKRKVGRSGSREERYAIYPMQVNFGPFGVVHYVAGGSITEAALGGVLNWERDFDEPERFVLFYDRETGEEIEFFRDWITDRAAASRTRIFGVNA
jgi:hypothetical protein